MYIHVSDSDSAKEFFGKHGIKISDDSSHNVLVLEDANGAKLKIWAEMAAHGIPGLYVSREPNDLIQDNTSDSVYD